MYRDEQTIPVIPEDKNRKSDDPLRGYASISRICGLMMSDNQTSYLIGGVIQINSHMYQNTSFLFFKMIGEDKDKDIVISLKSERVVDIQICQCRMCDGEKSLTNGQSVKNYQESYGQNQHAEQPSIYVLTTTYSQIMKQYKSKLYQISAQFVIDRIR